MKTFTINVVLVLLVLVLTLSSCGSGMENKESEEAEIVTLLFYDYSDFVKFGKEGILDPAKYENADSLKMWYSLVDGAFIDIRELLEMPVLPQGWTDCIEVVSNHKYHYSLCSTDEAGRKKLELSVNVDYHANTSDKPVVSNMKSINFVNSVDEIKEDNQRYAIQRDDITIIYSKNSNGYNGFAFSIDQLSIDFSFWDGGMPIDQIQERCGDTIAALLSDTPEVFSAATANLVDTINSRFHYETE